MHTTVSRALGPVLVLLLSACASTGSGDDAGPSYPDLAGEWAGSITIGGQAIPSSMQVTQEGPDLQILTRVPELGLNTRGEGTVLPDGRVRGTFSYNLECPGEAELIGTLTSDGAAIGGTILASDCTGDLEGTFSYRR